MEAAAVNWSPIYENAVNSIVFVMLTPSQAPGTAAERRRLATAAGTTTVGRQRNAALAASPLSTGYVVGTVGGELGILTTAHSIQHLFRRTMPITRIQINQLFTVQILCTHYENALRQGGVVDAPRAYTAARVAWIDCTQDLMLVVAPEAHLRSFADGGVPCHGPHPALLTCAGPDVYTATRECLLVSWPPYKPDTMSIGRIGTVRTVDEISRPNRVQYAMRVLEVQLSTEKGSSGGPLLNERGEEIGVLHGAHDPSHSYFICARHMRAFLRRFNIQAAPPAPAPPAP